MTRVILYLTVFSFLAESLRSAVFPMLRNSPRLQHTLLPPYFPEPSSILPAPHSFPSSTIVPSKETAASSRNAASSRPAMFPRPESKPRLQRLPIPPYFPEPLHVPVPQNFPSSTAAPSKDTAASARTAPPPTNASSPSPAAFPGIANIPRRQPLPRPPHSPGSPPFPTRHNFPFPTTALSNETATSSVSPVTTPGVANLSGALQPPMPPLVLIPPIVPILPFVPPLPNPPRLQGHSPETDAHLRTMSSRETMPFTTTSSSYSPETDANLKTMSSTKAVSSIKSSSSYGATASPRTAPSTRTAAPRKTTLSSRKATTRRRERMTRSSTKSTASTKMFNKRRNLEEFVKALEADCDFDLLDEVYKDLRHLWVKVKEEERSNRNQSEMDGLRKFLNNLVEQYNKCVNERLILDPDRQWKIYLKIFGKGFYNEKETEIRKATFKTKMDDMIKHNELYRNGLTSYIADLNRFSDWTEEELEKLNGLKPSNVLDRTKRMDRSFRGPNRIIYDYNPNDVLPVSFVWGRNYVTPVRDQGDCGSCYAFAGNGALEAYHKKQTGELVELSVQNILDCTWHLGNEGCDGGEHYAVFDYARTNGVAANFWYLYTMNASHNCRWKREHVAATDRGYYIISKGSEVALQHAVANRGTVAVGIGTKNIHQYRSGIFYNSDSGPVSHSALVVGYGSDPWGGDYWIVKNCWGFDWGEDGYMRIARNKHNMCHIASDAFLPY